MKIRALQNLSYIWKNERHRIAEGEVLEVDDELGAFLMRDTGGCGVLELDGEEPTTGRKGAHATKKAGKEKKPKGQPPASEEPPAKGNNGEPAGED